MKIFPRLALLVTVFALVLSACGSGSTSTSTSSSTATVPTAVASALADRGVDTGSLSSAEYISISATVRLATRVSACSTYPVYRRRKVREAAWPEKRTVP